VIQIELWNYPSPEPPLTVAQAGSGELAQSELGVESYEVRFSVPTPSSKLVSLPDTALFDSIAPFREGFLALDHGHQLHWQISGNPEGEPVLWIHGGPGSSASPMHRRLLDPAKYLIIQYDQRGCGRSRPKGEIRFNTTEDLLADIERLRVALNVQTWHVAGGSWGASLALLYAQSHPKVIRRVLLRSPFLCTDQEINAYLSAPPEACKVRWQLLADTCNRDGPSTILDYSHAAFCADAVDTFVATDRLRELARAWSVYEMAMDAWPAGTTPPTRFDDQALIARYRIHLHYLQARCFVQTPIVSEPERFRNLDLTIVHGEQDALCPFQNSLEIQRHISHAKVVPVSGAGHNAFDSRMVQAVMAEIRRWASEPSSV